MGLLDEQAAFGAYTTGRKYQKARERAISADVNTLPDPKTYAVAAGLLGVAPDEQGFSVLHPKYQEIKEAATPAYLLGLASTVAPLTKGLPVGASIKSVGKEPTFITSPVFGRYNPRAVPNVPQSTPERYVPARGLPEHLQNLMNNQDAYDQVKRWAQGGMTNDGIGWYNMEPLRKAFVGELGKKEGQAAFDQYIDLMAATSAGARTTDNARIASYYYVNGADGTPVAVPAKGSGYGHKAQQLHNRSANDILTGGGLDPIKNPKRFTFAENLRGNVDGVTVDKHNVRAWGMASKDPAWITNKFEDPVGIGTPSWWDEAKYGKFDPTMNPREFVTSNQVPWEQIPPTWFKGAPNANEYAGLELLNKKLAEDLGVRPAQGQAALWLGAGDVTGLGSPPLSMMNTFDKVLENRAKVRGQTPQEVLHQFITRQAPLVLAPGAVGLGLLNVAGEEDSQ